VSPDPGHASPQVDKVKVIPTPQGDKKKPIKRAANYCNNLPPQVYAYSKATVLGYAQSRYHLNPAQLGRLSACIDAHMAAQQPPPGDHYERHKVQPRGHPRQASSGDGYPGWDQNWPGSPSGGRALA
jgi:hypothetical protein